MNSDEMRTELIRHGGQVDESSDWDLGISGHYIRTTILGTPIFAVGAEKDDTTCIDALVHGIHWCRKRQKAATCLTIVWGTRGTRRDRRVLDPVATLLASYQGNLKICPMLNFKPWTPTRPALSNEGGRWKAPLLSRFNRKLPPTLEALANAIGSDSFRWYQSVTDESWSGRVEGLEVCTVELCRDDDCTAEAKEWQGRLDVGRPGKGGRESRERRAFREIVGNQAREFVLPDDQERVAETLRKVVQARVCGVLKNAQPEHLLESRVLRGDVPVCVEGVGLLEPVARTVPFQFPTVWTPGGNARFVDALMRYRSTPWVVELKVPTGGQASYYRHAVAQAVLYREFIRSARPLHDWFKTQRLKPEKCRAAVAFPEIRGPHREQLLGDLRASAADFDVAVIPLESTGL